jgi:hypothetical protein
MPGTTPNRGYPYPLGVDPIDVAMDIKRLADAVDVDAEAIQDDLARRGGGLVIANFGGTAGRGWKVLKANVDVLGQPALSRITGFSIGWIADPTHIYETHGYCTGITYASGTAFTVGELAITGGATEPTNTQISATHEDPSRSHNITLLETGLTGQVYRHLAMTSDGQPSTVIRMTASASFPAIFYVKDLGAA